jgi:hypothetical protein
LPDSLRLGRPTLPRAAIERAKQPQGLLAIRWQTRDWDWRETPGPSFFNPLKEPSNQNPVDARKYDDWAGIRNDHEPPFRLTSVASSPIKIFDAGANGRYVVATHDFEKLPARQPQNLRGLRLRQAIQA